MAFLDLFKRNAKAPQNITKDNKSNTSMPIKTFVCSNCGKTLAIKYVHKNNLCVNCAETKSNITNINQSQDSTNNINCENSEHKAPSHKTLFELYSTSKDLPGDNVYRSWANVIISESGILTIEENSITFSAHSLGHNTGRFTTHKQVSFEELPNLIAQSNDSKARKYVGMNQLNWREYIKEPQTAKKASKYPTLKFGNYEWYVLEQLENDTVLLLSKYGIDTLPWNNKKELVSWNESTLCHWLNTDFIKKFSFSEKRAFVKFEDNTRVSIPDESLIEKYLKNDSALTVQPTPYALQRGAFSYTYSDGRPDCKHHVGNGLSWLKDTYKGYEIKFRTWAKCIYWDGSVCMYSFDFQEAIVRPLIKIDLKKLK